MTGREIDNAVALLKLTCDPRGHELLDALADLARTSVRAADVLEGHRVFADNDRHSRRATDLKAV